MSPSSSLYPIRDLLANPDTPLGKLIAQARSIEDLNKTFQSILDPTLIPHCQVGTYENGVLTLLTESAAYATRLRFYIPTILSTLRNFSQWASLRSIQIKIKTYVPEISTSTSAPVHSLPLSPETLSNIRNIVSELKNKPGNEALISSLERLMNIDE